MTGPSISVVIDTYNYGRFVGQAIDSVLAQTYPQASREIVVVDDGSTDDTPQIVGRYGDRVRYLRKENGGQASAFNAGVDAARNELICFLDADDYFHPNKLERIAKAFAEHPAAGVVYNRYDVVDHAGKLKAADQPGMLPDGDVAGRTLLGYTTGCPASGISVRRSILAGIRVPEAPFRLSADHFYLNILPLLAEVVFLPETLHAYRFHGSNLYLRQTRDQRSEVHAAQQDALWDYARNDLGREFYRAEYELSGGRAPASSKAKTYVAGLHYLARSEAAVPLRLWSACKLTARLAFPPPLFRALRGVRDRLHPPREI